MTKLRKQRRRKVYRHNVNRKRLRNKQSNTGKVACKEVKEAWDSKKSVRTNMKEMGLSYDPNMTIKIPNYKEKIKASLKPNHDDSKDEQTGRRTTATKSHVAEALEAEAKAPRIHTFRMPKTQVEWVTYLIDKYGTDYKAMALDRKNYYQETWKQLRAKIQKFKSIPEQYSVYLKERNLNEDTEESNVESDGEL